MINLCEKKRMFKKGNAISQCRIVQELYEYSFAEFHM